MCLLVVHRDTRSVMTEQKMKAAWDNNPDGAGYAFVRDGRLVIRKPFFKLKKLTKAYYRDMPTRTGPAMVHFRLATHGPKIKNTTHPHQITTAEGGQMAMGHNGVLSMVSPIGQDSDTTLFARIVLDGRPTESLLGDTAWLASIIGTGNRLAFLSPDGRYSIVNESRGHWTEDGTWYSNDSYCDYGYGYGFGQSRGWRRLYSGAVPVGGWIDDDDDRYFGQDEDAATILTDILDEDVPASERRYNDGLGDDDEEVYLDWWREQEAVQRHLAKQTP